MKKVFCFFLLIAFLGFGFMVNNCLKVFGHGFKGEIPAPDQVALSIIDKTGNTLEKRYKMIPCGIGMREKFEFLEISFHIRRSILKEELRYMLIDSADEFLKNINSSEKIKPFLKNYPFAYKNVGIIFYIYDNAGYDLCHPNITIAEIVSGKLTFRTNDPENTNRYKETTKESIEEALQLINMQKAKKET